MLAIFTPALSRGGASSAVQFAELRVVTFSVEYECFVDVTKWDITLSSIVQINHNTTADQHSLLLCDGWLAR